MTPFLRRFGPLLAAWAAGALLIHPTYPVLFPRFQALRIQVNRWLHRPIAYAFWDAEQGIPLVHYGRVYGEDYGVRFNPLIACQWALERLLPEDTAGFVRLVHRIRARLPEDRVWHYDFALPDYGIPEGWTSAFTQALLADVFARAGTYAGDSALLQDARRALAPLGQPVQKGGTTLVLPDTGLWFLEYAYPPGPYPRVLNGMIWVLLSLHTYVSLTGDTTVERWFHLGERALRLSLVHYDQQGWSFYDRLGHPASETYQWMHLRLLQRMTRLTGQPDYLRWKRRWALGMHHPARARIAWGLFVLESLLLWGLLEAGLRGVRRFLRTGGGPGRADP